MALKVLEGTRNDRLNHSEPRLPIGSTIAPESLAGWALAKWNELAPLMANAGMFTEGDRSGLEMLCQEYAYIRANPDDSDKAKDRFRRMLVEFGLTPSSRSRLKSTMDPPKDKLGQFLDQKKA